MRGVLALLQGLGWLLSLLPPGVERALARLLAFLWWRCVPIRGEIARIQLVTSIPPQRAELLPLVGFNLARHLLLILSWRHQRRRGGRFPAQWTGRAHLDSALAQGRGVVVASAHIGPWEVLGQICQQAGYPLTVVVRRPRSKLIHHILLHLRRDHHLDLLFEDEGVVWRALHTLRQGGVVVVMVDQHHPGGYITSFLGRPACTSPLVAILAARARSVILPAYCIFRGDEIDVVVEQGLSAPEPGGALALTQALTQRVESWVEQDPAQWLWLHRRWKTSASSLPVPLAVLHVDGGLTWRGGQRQVYLLAREQLRAGLTVQVICQPESPLLRHCQAAGIPTLPVRIRHEVDLLAVGTIRGLLDLFPPQIVHTHDALGHGIMALTLGVRSSPLPPLVVHRRITTPLRRGPWSRFKYHQADHMIAVSEGVRQGLLAQGIPAECISMLPSVVDFPLVQQSPEMIRQHYGIPIESPLLVAVGALVRDKGHLILLQAIPRILAHYPTLRVVVAGAGPQQAALRHTLRRLQLQGVVKLVGEVTNPPDLMAICDVFVHPSLEEGLGTVLLEARALGRKVVASRVGGIPEALEGYPSHLLVPAGDVPALEEAILASLRGGPTEPASPSPMSGPADLATQTLRVYYHVLKQIPATPAILNR